MLARKSLPTMTDLLERAIGRLKQLPEERQDHLASRILSRIEEEDAHEARLIADLKKGFDQLDRGEGLDGRAVMDDLRERFRASD